ncbi:uncharacterized protein PV07_10505 [Cladophialophora immunda]|uniref:Uncharacterized protein n=1 Tax=Cladophialophora immunda TaxID=569365 RepID=A0A0D2C2U0_9EURO|nr:uncharacterized protein PV07_10505 [Cladophialophora immunda]KIW24815.1 hypothetical protein PV07_10505 [Cladophialophora immunda]
MPAATVNAQQDDIRSAVLTHGVFTFETMDKPPPPGLKESTMKRAFFGSDKYMASGEGGPIHHCHPLIRSISIMRPEDDTKPSTIVRARDEQAQEQQQPQQTGARGSMWSVLVDNGQGDEPRPQD